MAKQAIVAIGGGKLRLRETEKIDQYIINLTGSRNPRVLFIPTASLDDLSYVKSFTDVYGGNGCKVDTLYLHRGTCTPQQIDEKIMASDAVYVSGGNTLFLYNCLCYYHADAALRSAWERGTVLSGLSAGCIIWHDRGLTDSIHKKFVEMGGLGLVPRFCTPHYLREPKRVKIFEEIIKTRGFEGIAIDDNCAVVYEGHEIKDVLSLGEAYGAYIVKQEGKQVTSRPLDKTLLDHKTEPLRSRIKSRLGR